MSENGDQGINLKALIKAVLAVAAFAFAIAAAEGNNVGHGLAAIALAILAH